MEIQLTGVMNDEGVEELQRIAQRFMGKQVKVIIQEFNGEEKSRRRREGCATSAKSHLRVMR